MLPGFHVGPVKKPQPLTRMAGQALMASTVRAKTSAARGRTSRDPRCPPPACSSWDRRASANRRATGARRFVLALGALVFRTGVAHSRSMAVTDYWILMICFSDCATTLAGSGWKLTWLR